MRQPLHQAVLVDELDTPATFARMEQRLHICALRSTYPAGVCLHRAVVAGSAIRYVLGIVHDVRFGRRIGLKICHRGGVSLGGEREAQQRVGSWCGSQAKPRGAGCRNPMHTGRVFSPVDLESGCSCQNLRDVIAQVAQVRRAACCKWRWLEWSAWLFVVCAVRGIRRRMILECDGQVVDSSLRIEGSLGLREADQLFIRPRHVALYHKPGR